MSQVHPDTRTSKPASARTAEIQYVFANEFGDLIRRDPEAFQRKFQKMAKNAFAFYRGSACLFYHDVVDEPDDFLNDQTSRVWIHGDQHAENFGTYMNSLGRFVFNVNDFDEAYVGPYTWDLKRFAASIYLLGVSKALSDSEISTLISEYGAAYADEIAAIAAGGDDAIGELSLATTATGSPLRRVLQAARAQTRVALLESRTTIVSHDRRFAISNGASTPDEDTYAAVVEAFQRYIETLQPAQRERAGGAKIKDIVARKGMGIGSAGLPSYEILLEGETEALQDDVIVYMKQAQVPAVSRHITDDRVQHYFTHQGHRTCESQRALQAHSDQWIGYTTLNGVGQFVAEVSPYSADLSWDDVTTGDDLRTVVGALGRSSARMHSVADDESQHDLVTFSTEEAITAAIGTDRDGFTKLLVDFGHRYGRQADSDWREFVDLSRNGQLTADVLAEVAEPK